MGRIVSLNVSGGGVPKLPVASGRLGATGLEGDRHVSPKHGGPDRAVCLYSVEQLARLEAEGHGPVPGSLGENVTLEGIDLAALEPGARLALGAAAVVVVTSRVAPCRKIASCFTGGDFERISPVTRPEDARLYARVLVAGDLATGDHARVL